MPFMVCTACSSTTIYVYVCSTNYTFLCTLLEGLNVFATLVQSKLMLIVLSVLIFMCGGFDA